MDRRRFMIFFSIVVTIWALVHVFIGLSLVPGIQPAWAGWLVVAGLFALPVITMFVGRVNRHIPFKAAIEWAGFTSMGLSTILLVLAPAAALLHADSWLEPRMVTAWILGLAIAYVVVGVWRSRRPLVVRVDVPIQDLPHDLEGFRILQISDLHIGPTLKRGFVERVVQTANSLEPHLIALTGDVADGLPLAMHDEVAPLSRLGAPYGKFFVTGNHEYYWDALGWVKEVERLGFDPLVNSHRVIKRGGSRILLAGVTDSSASAWTPGHRFDPQAAVSGAPETDFKLLLAHQPSNAFAAQKLGFDLQLSGHTHGGQYFPFSLLVRLFQPFVHGLHKVKEMWLYVSRGTGYWGPPMRIGAPSEITLLQLVRA